ncbi:MAG TPA: response regulator [Kofleriaceae bacterium]|nr:response regulator [Kofleriaceae bacterium]
MIPELAALGFGLVWIARIDEQTGDLATVKLDRNGTDATHEAPARFAIDPRLPIGHGFRDRRILNIPAPDALHIFDRDDDVVPPNTLGMTRAGYDRMRGHPFACGPLLGAGGEPVGAVWLGSYRGAQPISDEVLDHGALPAILALLAIAVERVHHTERADRLAGELARARDALVATGPIRTIGELALGAAHDLNNLAGIARIAVEVGARSATDAVEQLPRIERVNRAIIDLVKRVQRVAWPARAAPASEAADLTRTVDDVVVLAGPQLRAQGIELDAELPQLPPVRCDAALIHQVVLNLVVNAQDALAEVAPGRRRIEIRALQDAGMIRLTVADTGPGIAPDVLARLFRAAFTTKAGGHMGLGLSASQAALAAFGAKLSARNALTGGAVFELTLVPATASAAEPEVPAPRPAATPAHARILVVDDDLDIVDIILAFLEPFGHALTTATTSAQALEIAAAQSFDLVLCDVGMPKLSGLDVARALRTAGYRGKLVLMTGWDAPTLSADARDAAIDMLLKKPFIGADLIAMIETLLAR